MENIWFKINLDPLILDDVLQKKTVAPLEADTSSRDRSSLPVKSTSSFVSVRLENSGNIYAYHNILSNEPAGHSSYDASQHET